MIVGPAKELLTAVSATGYTNMELVPTCAVS
jgi:hypothetical protein